MKQFLLLCLSWPCLAFSIAVKDLPFLQMNPQTSFQASLAMSQNKNPMSPQPIIINGGNLPALHVYHQPMWLPPIVINNLDEIKSIKDLEELNKKIERELREKDPKFMPKTTDLIDETDNPSLFTQNLTASKQPGFSQKIIIGDLHAAEDPFKASAIEVKSGQEAVIQEIQGKTSSLLGIDRSKSMSFMEKFKNRIATATCVKKEGFVKVREADQKSKEVPKSYAILSKDRLSYFIDPKDESSVQGSIELKDIITPIMAIERYPSCFEIKTANSSQDCGICVEDEKTALEWQSAITQNIVNCG